MKSFLKRAHQSDEMTLQITSMADIFTILLVFLLKSYATSAVNVTPSQSLTLPQAGGGDTPVEALKLEVTATAIQVEGQPVLTLEKYRFAGGEVAPNGSSKTLAKALERERQRQLLIAKANSDVKVDSKILVVADQHVPYATLKSVLASAALNGYTDFKLAVVKGE